MLIQTFNNIESTYDSTERRKRRINQEYKLWIRIAKENYAEIVIGLAVLTDKQIEWEEKNEEMGNIYKKLIKKLRKHMKKMEVA